MGPVSHVALVTIAQRQDYRTGWRALQRILAMSEDRNYEPDASQARFLYVLSTGHWFDRRGQRTPGCARRERLLHGGDLQNACFTYIPVMHQLIEYAPSLDSYAEEVESGQTSARRTGNDLAAEMIRGSVRWCACCGARAADRSSTKSLPPARTVAIRLRERWCTSRGAWRCGAR